VWHTFYNLLVDAADIALALCVLVFLPLAFFRSKRTIAGKGFKAASFIFFLNLWVYSAMVLLHYWGVVALVLGILLSPIVAGPLAAIAACIYKNWWGLFVILSYMAQCIATCVAGDKLTELGEPPEFNEDDLRPVA
jgi:hypothetical protein